MQSYFAFFKLRNIFLPSYLLVHDCCFEFLLIPFFDFAWQDVYFSEFATSWCFSLLHSIHRSISPILAWRLLFRSNREVIFSPLVFFGLQFVPKHLPTAHLFATPKEHSAYGFNLLYHFLWHGEHLHPICSYGKQITHQLTSTCIA